MASYPHLPSHTLLRRHHLALPSWTVDTRSLDDLTWKDHNEIKSGIFITKPSCAGVMHERGTLFLLILVVKEIRRKADFEAPFK